jgi:hypothetical protein
MSRQPTSNRPPQSMAPQSMAPQSMVDPRIRADPRNQTSSARPSTSSASSGAFDPKSVVPAAAAAGGAPVRKHVQKYRPIDDKTKKIIPSTDTIREACRISLEVDKPIILTFWFDSILRNVYINKKEGIIEKIKENHNDEGEYTSEIKNVHGNGIFETENSIYIVVPDITQE